MPLIDPKTTVLLICDVQERFRSAIFGFDAMVGTIAKMVRAAQLLEIPVITTEQNPKALGSTVRELGLASLPPQLDLGTWPKTRFSMTLAPVLDHLQQRQTQSAIIVGIEVSAALSSRSQTNSYEDILATFHRPTCVRLSDSPLPSHVCVLQTALSLLENQIVPYVPADGVSSCNRPEIAVALDRLRQEGARVTTSESVLFELVGDAASPLFKPFANLVKESKESTKAALDTLLDATSKL